MSAPPLSDADAQAAAIAARDHESNQAAADSLGLSLPAFKSRLRVSRRRAATGVVGGPPIPAAAIPPAGFAITTNNGAYDAEGNLLRQWVGSRRDSGAEYELPAGHVVKGESALVDPDGRVLARWIKTREGAGAGLVEALRDAFADYRGAAPIVAQPVDVADDLLTVYPLPDLHLGMYAWDREAGADYDVDIAVKLATRTFESLIAQSQPSRRAVLLGLGDYFHTNGGKPMTPQSGHILDVDTRWARVFACGARLATAIVGLLAAKHAEVEVVMLPGNHDLDAAMSLTVALALFYSATPHIQVHQEPGVAWYRRFGAVLLGATHGHTMKPDRMAMMLAADRPVDWGETKHRSFFFGHVHHGSALEVGPVRVESFNTPAARDAYAAGAGYRSGRSLSAITFHAERGEIGRHRVNIA